MIPRTRLQGTDWRHELRQAITDPQTLLESLQLPLEHWLSGARTASRHFPLKVPRGFVARMEPGNPHDPLLRQVLPLAEEDRMVEGFTHDPVGDLAATCEPGLIRKYRGRALAIATGACAVHCRYCFRRHFPYADSHAGGSNWDHALSAIQTDISLREVILSGGDPLMLDDEALTSLFTDIWSIRHIDRIRIHTRLPVVVPERVTDSLLELAASSPIRIVMVIHCNHPNEIHEPVRESLLAMHQAGVTLLNQSVLLHGVNDNTQVLTRLSEALFDCRVQPYYLHLLDRVQGSAHFDIPLESARSIVGAMSSQLPGYLVPKLVREIEGMPSKTSISI